MNGSPRRRGEPALYRGRPRKGHEKKEIKKTNLRRKRKKRENGIRQAKAPWAPMPTLVRVFPALGILKSVHNEKVSLVSESIVGEASISEERT